MKIHWLGGLGSQHGKEVCGVRTESAEDILGEPSMHDRDDASELRLIEEGCKVGCDVGLDMGSLEVMSAACAELATASARRLYLT